MKLSPKQLALAAALILTVGSAGFALSGVSADDTDTTTKTFMERLAEKLGLSSDVVESAADEVQDEVQTERVTAAVESGDLTEAQAALLEKIHEYRQTNEVDHQAEMEALQDLSGSERRAAMEAKRSEELTAMATALGVSEDEIEATLEAAHEAHVGGPMMGGRGGRGGRGMHDGNGEGFGRGMAL